MNGTIEVTAPALLQVARQFGNARDELRAQAEAAKAALEQAVAAAGGHASSEALGGFLRSRLAAVDKLLEGLATIDRELAAAAGAYTHTDRTAVPPPAKPPA
jgi:uncharacterized protein YukE